MTDETPSSGPTTISSRVGNEQRAQQITEAEVQLIKLRAARDERILASYDEGLPKYRLAKDWGINENTITRIVSRRRAGQRRSRPALCLTASTELTATIEADSS